MVNQHYDKLKVHTLESREAMGRAAALDAATHLREVLARQGHARIIVASAPSQNELLKHLVAEALPWDKITVFHMDEYIGLPADHAATFRAYQREHLLARVKPAAFHGIAGESADPQEVARTYGRLLQEKPIDLCCMGVGENGHIAFNDPPVADFKDPHAVKVVELDEACRQQQVNDGCFPDFASVPTHALTLTVPTLMSARHLVCVVPGSRKAAAIKAMLHGPISTACPASILRRHDAAYLYLDRDSAALLDG